MLCKRTSPPVFLLLLWTRPIDNMPSLQWNIEMCCKMKTLETLRYGETIFLNKTTTNISIYHFHLGQCLHTKFIIVIAGEATRRIWSYNGETEARKETHIRWVVVCKREINFFGRIKRKTFSATGQPKSFMIWDSIIRILRMYLIDNFIAI